MKWPQTFTIAQAREAQERMQKKISIVPLSRKPRIVAGVDAAFSDDKVFAAACLYKFPELALIEQKSAVRKLDFPYVPGFLAFREGPAVIDAMNMLTQKPDLILVDGQGIAHPRGIGLASFVGLQTGIPSIGCAKSRLIGEYREPGSKRGRWSPLVLEGRTIGAVLRTRDNTRPLFVSAGHKIDLVSAIRLTLACTKGYRIPEPLRCADHLSKQSRDKG